MRSASSAIPMRTAPRRPAWPASSLRTEIAERVEELASLADELMDERAADRIGETVDVLIDEVLPDGRYLGGRSTRRLR